MNTYKLEDICIKITDGAHHSPKSVENSGFPMASVKDLTPFGINIETCRQISEEDFNKLVKQGCKPEVNDILIAKDGNSCLETVMVQREEQKVVLLSSVAILKPNISKVDPRYLSLYFSEQNIIKDMKERLVSGSAIPRVILKAFREYEVKLPSLDIQKKVASIIGTLNDKIELNQTMNQTLEEIAMTLYKHWFVDFGPFQDGDFVESELGMIPKGWEVLEIGNAVKILGGGTPKTSVEEFWNGGKINWFSPTDLTTQKSLFVTNSAKKITKLGLEKSSAKLFPPYSVMMTSRATIGEISINRKEASTNQGFITLIPNEDFSIYQLYFWLRSNMEIILSISNGSTFKEVSKTNFKKLKILKTKGIEEFINKCEKLFNKIELNILESEELTRLRNYLLPRLLSGEIDVTKAEKQIKEVL